MTRDDTLLWLLGGSIAAWIIVNRGSVSGSLETGVETVTAAVSGWQNVNDGPVWVPVINQSEAAYGIPANLLARQAYQESHFRREIIDGTTPSSAGALGILQLMPQYFDSVNVPRPYTSADTQAQITQAAQQMQSLYSQFGDWGLALAAYNDGAQNVKDYLAGTRPLPLETQTYVAQILTDVPVPSMMTA
jgi:soluble lytic murein transglycosylase-like protein